MRCEQCRDAVSARLDGEPFGVPEDAVAEHLRTCAACRAFAGAADELHRAMRVRPAEAVPDLSEAILAKARRPAGQPFEWARYALLTVALTQLVLALPALVLGHDPGASLHVAREMGSFDVALGVGLLVAAWQPARANGLLPFAAALAGTLMLTAALDVADGRVPIVGEAHHVLDVAGLALLWLLTKSVNAGWQPPRFRLRSRPA